MCCCSMKFWGLFLAAILGGLMGLLVMTIATPCYHDLFAIWTGHELPWKQTEHHVHDNSTVDVLETLHTFNECWVKTGWPILCTYMFVAMGIAVVLYIIAIFACMCHCCCRRQRYDGQLMPSPYYGPAHIIVDTRGRTAYAERY